MDKLEINRAVLDTSILISQYISESLDRGAIKVEEIIIPLPALAELQNQANKGLDKGFVGLKEVQKLRENAEKYNYKISIIGFYPKDHEIKSAKEGSIDFSILEITKSVDGVLLTSDKVLYELSLAYGVKAMYIDPNRIEKPSYEIYFTEDTMSVHIIEGCKIKRKRGSPGNWYIEEIDDILDRTSMENLVEEIISLARTRRDGFIEIEKPNSIVVQQGIYRIVIVKPPLSDSYEITIVRPIIKKKLEDYKLSDVLIERLEKSAEGIIIAGKPGSGKSTFAQALAEWYRNKGKIVKTIESPRDLDLSQDIVQYSKNFAKFGEIHDILLLSRPDYVIFDEMRNTEDFKLYIDLRFAGVGMIGVLHVERPIDAIHRLISRAELGIIPHVVDTIIFIERGQIEKVYTLELKVKVPTGMTEEDLARPVVEVRDILTGDLEYELYTFGEEIVVVPVKSKEKNKLFEFLKDLIKERFSERYEELDVDIVGNSIRFYLPKEIKKKFIKREKSFLRQISYAYKFRVEVLSKDILKHNIYPKNIKLIGDYILIDFGKEYAGKKISLISENELICKINLDKKGKVNISLDTDIGRKLKEIIEKNKEIHGKI
ncbi:MAG: ATPase, T2SS/T4P/T4SS family [Nanopusillaceae archaeon]